MTLVAADENDDWAGEINEAEAIQIRDFGLRLLNTAHQWLDTEG